jgi:cytochrome o ubiquinol oxidase subunit I
MTRRMQHYADKSWQPLLVVAEVGAIVILCGIIATIAQLVHSIRTRERRRDLTGDPWQGRTLEWSTASPPPAYNFAILPRVTGLDAFWQTKQQASDASPLPAPSAPPAPLEPIEMPANSANGFITAFFAVLTGFALIWHIWWLALLGIVSALATLVGFGWIERHGVDVTVEELAADERSRRTVGSALDIAPSTPSPAP